ncbi:MAG: SpoIIE family protein phosphatase [Spirochaetota bacterium]
MLKYLNVFRLIRDMKLQTKMIFLITGVVLISVVPLSYIVLQRNQAVVRDKTIEVCKNLGNNISNLATEELLINETYDDTRTALARLKDSSITGLLESYVLNIDGKYVADLHEQKENQAASPEEKKFYLTLPKLVEQELLIGKKKVLRFSYPIFIDYKKEKMRVGTAVFEFDKEKVYEPVRKIRRTIFMVSGIAFAVAIIIAISTAFYFTSPLKRLSEGAEIIGGGQLEHRIQVKRRDELGQLAFTFNQMTEQIQDFTHNLELKVKERTEELNRTLQEVQALKVAQDGDYYLTSLLLSPLQQNNNKSRYTKTHFYIEQKKKFKFRKWDAHIGGDICISDSIQLNGKTYTVILNGDAMGKSIQGAGGALVLGVVFNAALTRSRLVKNEKVYPEAWLKERFLDLHNVFISFEGSMYISVCMGLVEEDTGLFYYINAEHPWTVLFRDGIASFMEEELEIRKLGTPEQEDRFRVRIFQLLPGDVVITGSDGRDDLILTNEETGEEFVQEDETEFLRRVEEGEGNLEKIVKAVKENGKLMDDFTLLRVGYNETYETIVDLAVDEELGEKVGRGSLLVNEGKEEEALRVLEDVFVENQKYPDLLKLLGRLYYNKKEFARAAQCFEEYLNVNPGDNEYLYALSNTTRQVGNLHRAADLGERLYLRQHNHYLNLVNLAMIYRDLEIYARAKKMIERAIDINPDKPDVARLYREIREEARAKEDSLTEERKESIREEYEKHIVKAKELYQKKKYFPALVSFKKAMALDEQSSKLMFKIANCCFFTNNYKDAIRFYHRAIAINGSNYRARNNLGKVFFEQKEFENAREQWLLTLGLKEDFKPAIVNIKRLDTFLSARKREENGKEEGALLQTEEVEAV